MIGGDSDQGNHPGWWYLVGAGVVYCRGMVGVGCGRYQGSKDDTW